MSFRTTQHLQVKSLMPDLYGDPGQRRALPRGERQNKDKTKIMQKQQQPYLESGHHERRGFLDDHRCSECGHRSAEGGKNPLVLEKSAAAETEQAMGAPKSGEDGITTGTRRANVLAGGGLLVAV